MADVGITPVNDADQEVMLINQKIADVQVTMNKRYFLFSIYRFCLFCIITQNFSVFV